MADWLLSIAQLLSVWALPVLLAVTLHEAAHAYAAQLLGDDTAARMGRLSLNPLAMVLLPVIDRIYEGVLWLTGWA